MNSSSVVEEGSQEQTDTGSHSHSSSNYIHFNVIQPSTFVKTNVEKVLEIGLYADDVDDDKLNKTPIKEEIRPSPESFRNLA